MIEQGDLLKQEIQARSSEDSKSLNVEQTHDRTGRPVTDTAAVQDDSQVYHEANTLNVDDEVLRKRMEKSIVVNSSSDRTGRLVETEEIQARSSEEIKRLNVEQTHDRSGRPVNDTVAVQDDSQVYHEANTLNFDDETLREK